MGSGTEEQKTCLTFSTVSCTFWCVGQTQNSLKFSNVQKIYQIFFLFEVDVAMSDLALVFLYQKISLEADTHESL